jgi:hypothetical protein
MKTGDYTQNPVNECNRDVTTVMGLRGGHERRSAVKCGTGPLVKIVLKATLALAFFTIAALALCFSWFYFYSGDLPNFAAVANFAPASSASVADVCSPSEIRVIPYASLGKSLQGAVRAAEGESDELLALQISRGLFCDH